MYWAYFMELTSHTHDGPGVKARTWYTPCWYKDTNDCDFGVWDEIVDYLEEHKFNMMVIDLGDGVLWESHPEISAPDAVTKEFLLEKLNILRKKGITPIPKFNFSTIHDAWLKEYNLMVGSTVYRKVCADLIDEACELFGKPELFHLGLDEETSLDCHRIRENTIMRGERLLWEDYHHLMDCCRKNGARPWMWADYQWSHKDLFPKMVDKDVMISNWFYSEFKDYDKSFFLYDAIDAYQALDKLGYDQIPTCSRYDNTINCFETAVHCRKNISSGHLKGFLVAPWVRTEKDNILTLKENAFRLFRAREDVFPETLK